MKRLIAVIIVANCLFLFSCDYCSEPVIDEGDVILKTGQVCGWCGGHDSLTVTESTSYYEFQTPCDSKENKNIKEATQNWNELLAKLDWDKFTAININTCHVCADGCDIWIYIKKDGVVHQIRFGDNSPEIEPIKPFVEQLNALRLEFKNR